MRKFRASIIFAVSLLASVSGFSQITLVEKNASLQKVFNQIQKQSGYDFLYDYDLLQKQGNVNVENRNVSLKEALETCLKDKALSFSIVDNTVIIQPKEEGPGNYTPEDAPAPPPAIEIRGVVKDESGKFLQGASVTVKGSSNGTATNEKGAFTISVSNELALLVVSYVGMESQEISIKGKTDLSIKLKTRDMQQQELVVVGYGKQARSKLTSSVSSIKTDQFKDAPYTNIQAALQGRVPGVIVESAGGEPGSVPNLTIRGGEPLVGQTAPLYVIDGIVRDQAAFVALNVNDVADISFLKDASATAVYGAAAGAGIVLVTTKQGVAGKPSFSYSNNLAWNTPSLFPKLIDSYGKALVANAIGEAKGNGVYSAYSPEQLNEIKNGTNPDLYPNTNWYDLAFKKYSMQQNHSLSMSGGSKQSKYYVGLGYFNQGSNYINTDAEKMQRFSYNTKLTSNFEQIGLNMTVALNGYYSQFVQPPAGSWSIFSHIVAKSPLEKAFNSDGSLSGLVDHPLAEIYSPGYSKNEMFFNDGNLNLNWQVPGVKGLQLTAIGDYSFTLNPTKTFSLLATQYNPDGSVYPTSKPTLSQSQSNSTAYNLQFHVNYAKTIGKNNLDATFVYDQRAGKNSWFSAYRPNFPSAAIDQLFAGDASQQINDGSASEWGSLGYVGRIKYDFDSKYLIELSGRYDGSDYFPPDKRFGFFPAASLGWAMSKEKFYQNLHLDNVFSYFKLRSSFGEVGMIGGTKYAYLPQYNVNSQVYVAGGQLQNGYSEGALTVADQNITWYSTKSFDLGFDFTALHSKLKGGFDYFYTRTKNILGSPAYRYTEPLGQPLPQVLTDAATRKEGVEGYVNYTWKMSKDLSFYAGVNVTYYNYLWEKTNEDSVTLSNPNIRMQGVDYNYYGTMYTSNGIYQNYNDILNNPTRLTSTGLMPGDLWLKDVNGDGKIDAQDQKRLGHSSSPHLVYGFTLGASYKGFTLDLLIQGTGSRNSYMGYYTQAAEGLGRTNFEFQTDYWTSTNTGARYPRPGDNTLNAGNNYTSSSFWLVNTQYVRLKNLTLNYDFKTIIKKKEFFLNQISVFLSGTNLLTWSSCKKYFDPELADNNNFFYPVNKTFSTGVRIGF